MLQCRVGKRNGVAAVRMAVEMNKDKRIKLTAAESVLRVPAEDLVHCLLPMLDPKTEKDNGVGKYQFRIAYFLIGERIHNRDPDHNKQVGHLLNWNRIRSVSYNTEYGEEPQGESQFQFYIIQQEAQ